MPKPLRLHRSAICLAASIFLVQVSLAQTLKPPGSTSAQNILVTVNDENDVAVPSALVFLQAAPQAVALRCVTDFAGHCQFSNLSAGTYQLRVEKQGFYSAMLPAVQTSAAANIDVTLSHQQEVREVVDVVESPPAIDPAQIAAQQTLSGLDVLNIPYPATHDYRNVLNFIPGVVQDVYGQPHIAGAETYQTVTLLDGFNITQPASGQLLARISTDAFRSIQVEPSREPAEFGKGSGGLLQLNTGIGDDHFHFYATNFVPSIQDKGGLKFDQILPRLTFSGPLKKRKVWFYDAVEGEYDNIVYTELPANADNDHLLRVGNLAKLQANVTSRNIVTGSFLVNHLHDDYYGLSPLSPQLSNPSDVESAYIASVKDQYYFPGGELLEAGLAFDQYNLKYTPYGTLPYFITPETLGETASGSYYLSATTRARRWQALSNLFLPPHHWYGRHDLELGVDLDRLMYDAQFARQPASFLRLGQHPPTAPNTCLTPLPSPCSVYSTFAGGSPSSTYNFESSAYIEDRWAITNRLLVEPGSSSRLGRSDPHPAHLPAPGRNLRPRQLGQYQSFRGNRFDLRSYLPVPHRPSICRSTHRLLLQLGRLANRCQWEPHGRTYARSNYFFRRPKRPPSSALHKLEPGRREKAPRCHLFESGIPGKTRLSRLCLQHAQCAQRQLRSRKYAR